MKVRGAAYRGASYLVHRSQPHLRRAWQSGMIRRGVDVTTSSSHRSCLVLAPHPDDETLGCGATIARKRAAGTPVRVVIAADGRYAQHRSERVTADQLRQTRAAEAVDACVALGLSPGDLVQLGHEDTRLDQDFSALVDQISTAISDFDPDEILVASVHDHHPDHRTLNLALRDVLASRDLRCHVAEFPVWFWADGPWIGLSERQPPARALHFLTEPIVSLLRQRTEIVSTDGHLARKREALRAHRSQTTNLTGEATWAVMDDEFLSQFLLPYEVFFPLRRAVVSRATRST